MINETQIAITRGRRQRLVVRPGEGVSMRAVASSLREGGVAYTSEPGASWMEVEVDMLDRLLPALSSWQVGIEPALKTLAENMHSREKQHGIALAIARELAVDHEAAGRQLVGYAGLPVLDPHQVTAVAIASHPTITGLCLFDEQGLGKTVEALFAFDRLRELELIDRVVVFAPKNMVLEWVNDLGRFFPGKYRAVAVVGTEAEKRTALDTKADLYVTNFETAVRLAPSLRDVLGKRGLLIVDESFFVKNTDSMRTSAVKRIREAAARCIVLCGTPAPNSAVDVVEQFNIADNGVAFAGVSIPKDPEEAREVVAGVLAERGIYLRRLKSEVLALPERSFNRILVELEPQQRRLYDSVLSGLVEDVTQTDEETFQKRRASFAARRMMLLQACSNPSALDPEYSALPAKLAALEELLYDLVVRRSEKVLIWSFFTRSLDAIAKRFGHYGVARIDGTVTSTDDRRDAVRRFQSDRETMVFLGNPAAAGAGLTLHRARHAIYESMSNQAAHYLQSLDRIHRRGQEREVEYHVLLANGTIELGEYERLLRKEAAAQDLLGDAVTPPITRELFLAELISSRI